MLKILVYLLLWWGFAGPIMGSPTLKVNGSSTVNPVIGAAVEYFQSQGMRIFLDSQGGSSGGIAFVAEGMADIGLSSRAISKRDQKKFPGTDFKSHVIGYDGVGLVVSTNLYNRGVKALTRKQIKGIYEGKISNWSQVGGPDRSIVFFNKEPGRGTWEVFVEFVYGSSALAPKVFHPEVGSNQEARTKVSNHLGGITQLSAAWANANSNITAIAIIEDERTTIPDFASITSGAYPIVRPLILVTNGSPGQLERTFIQYFLTSAGRELVAKHGFVPTPPQDSRSVIATGPDR